MNQNNGARASETGPVMRERSMEATGDRYRSLKVTARAKQKLDLIASTLQKPLTQVVEEMADQWWDQVVGRNLLPMSHNLSPPPEED